jgi:hypothetical protein
MKKICEFCGKEFNATQERIKNCSMKCFLEGLRKKRTKTCEVCGDKFENSNKRIKRCSLKCYYESLRKTNKIIYQDEEKTILDVSTKKYPDQQTIIDTKIHTIEFISNGRWHVDINRDKLYVRRTINGKSVKLHRFIMDAKKGEHIDHKSLDTLDNRKCNLRVCTNAQNVMNRPISKLNKSGFKGVSKEGNRWKCLISYDGKQRYLGLFKNKIDAAKKYNEQAIIHHGEFARLNDV